jgi:hypothetical protein
MGGGLGSNLGGQFGLQGGLGLRSGRGVTIPPGDTVVSTPHPSFGGAVTGPANGLPSAVRQNIDPPPAPDNGILQQIETWLEELLPKAAEETGETVVKKQLGLEVKKAGEEYERLQQQANENSSDVSAFWNQLEKIWVQATNALAGSSGEEPPQTAPPATGHRPALKQFDNR